MWMSHTLMFMRQFGVQQHISQDPPNFDELHKVDSEGS
jgi:hypothetical protein